MNPIAWWERQVHRIILPNTGKSVIQFGGHSILRGEDGTGKGFSDEASSTLKGERGAVSIRSN